MTQLNTLITKSNVQNLHVNVGFVMISLMILGSFQSSLGQSGIGVGFVFSSPQSGGISLRYKPIQILADVSFTASGGTGRSTQTNFSIPGIAVRYNHSVQSLQRLNFHFFGQIGRRTPPAPILPTRVLFTGGGSAEYKIGGNSSPTGLFLTVDVGLTIDHEGNLSGNPARGVALHYMF